MLQLVLHHSKGCHTVKTIYFHNNKNIIYITHLVQMQCHLHFTLDWVFIIYVTNFLFEIYFFRL